MAASPPAPAQGASAATRPRRGWLLAVLAAALAVAVLRVLSWDDVGSPLQVAMQAALPAPLALGAAACLPQARAQRRWLAPAIVFLAGVPGLGYAWTDYQPRPGDEWCGAKGFVPEPLGQALEPAAGTLLWLALAAAAAGGVLLARPASRALGAWLMAAAFAVGVEWFALPVCMGT